MALAPAPQPADLQAPWVALVEAATAAIAEQTIKESRSMMGGL
jgi:hypothetical protein